MDEKNRRKSEEESAKMLDLRRLFPQVDPITGPPSLGSLNGCGLGIYGERDHCPKTGTYVKTHVFMLLFIPVIALGAYRVADAEKGGWYFLGKEPLSNFARKWNYFALLLMTIAISVFGWDSYTSSSTYLAAKDMEKATILMDSGKYDRATKIYCKLIKKQTPKAREAQASLIRMVDQHLQTLSPEMAEKILHQIIQIKQNPPMFPDLFRQGLTIYEKYKNKYPKKARKILLAIAPVGDKKIVAQKKWEILQMVYRVDPADVPCATELALIYEKKKNYKKCKQILEPLKKSLALGEGARILGQIYVREGNLEDSNALLVPYVQRRLIEFHKADKAYQAKYQRVWDMELESLKIGNGPPILYREYPENETDQKEQMVRNYLQDQVKRSTEIIFWRKKLSKKATVVPLALDLGIVKLQLATKLRNPADRTKELKSAEKIFLAIKGVVGTSDRYLLSLGQVYYWMSREKDGKNLFDQVLANNKRNPATLLVLAGILRKIGRISQASSLEKEAYGKAKKSKKRKGHKKAEYRKKGVALPR